MKKALVAFVLLLTICTYAAAQNYTEVVYLKNGSVIKGIITEQVPNVSLKIQTADGSLIICKMDEVDKITKENFNTQRHRNMSRTTLKGYKGMVDLGYIFDTSDTNSSKLSVSTSHGYQFNNHFFLGAGMACDYYTDADLVSVPIFTHFKANFINKRITPFADIKTGYAVGDIEGFYVTTGVGVRFGLAGKKAISLKLEYNFQDCSYDESYYFNGNYYSYDYTSSLEGLGLKVGFEF